jgi:putative transposon-encoded protein
MIADRKTKAKRKLHSASSPGKVRFEIYGEEMLQKKVKMSSSSGRVYLPPDWVGHQVKIIRID